MRHQGTAAVGLIAALAMVLGGCGFFTQSGVEQAEDSLAPEFNIEIGQEYPEGGIEGIDYECVYQAKDISPPPPPLEVDRVIIKPKPLCPPGQVPQAKVKYYNHPKGFPPSHLDQPRPLAVKCWYGACYDYVESSQYVSNKGAFARLTQHLPMVDPQDGLHSVAEVAVVDDSRDIIEVGWRRYRSEPTKLFVSWWENDEFQCYNQDCPGWVQVDPSYYPGMPISVNGESQNYAIRYINGNWWIYYKSIPMGYYPSGLWSPPFSIATSVRYYGEVATTDQTGNTTTDMGNGLWPSSSRAARIDDQRYWTGSIWRNANTTKWASSPERYDYRATSSRSMRYGGPGCTSNC
jgi:hypothetical protein